MKLLQIDEKLKITHRHTIAGISQIATLHFLLAQENREL